MSKREMLNLGKILLDYFLGMFCMKKLEISFTYQNILIGSWHSVTWKFLILTGVCKLTVLV
jgi:hypothetical protein